jgi:hypothetical protein
MDTGNSRDARNSRTGGMQGTARQNLQGHRGHITSHHGHQQLQERQQQNGWQHHRDANHSRDPVDCNSRNARKSRGTSNIRSQNRRNAHRPGTPERAGTSAKAKMPAIAGAPAQN